MLLRPTRQGTSVKFAIVFGGLNVRRLFFNRFKVILLNPWNRRKCNSNYYQLLHTISFLFFCVYFTMTPYYMLSYVVK